MKNSSAEELMHAIETVLAGEIYASSTFTSLRCESWPAAEWFGAKSACLRG
jgi:DNA-binding NarL/FixJ family response regulator